MIDWSDAVRNFRLRHGMSQERLSELLGVSQRTVSRWERGDGRPSLRQQRHLRDIGWQPTVPLMTGLAAAVAYCPAPRALSRTRRLCLQAVSPPALRKRPSIVNWIGCDLRPIASGILLEMLDDRSLQRSIDRREVAAVVTTTRSVLDTPEAPSIGCFETTIGFFHHDGSWFSDAISVKVPNTTPLGYRAITMDEILQPVSGSQP